MNIYVNIVVLTKVRPDHIIKLLHTTPCYVSPRDTLTNGNNVPAANCHLTGCLLSHDGCWLGSPFTAGFGSVTRITHTSLGSVCLHFLGQTRWRSSTYGSASVLDVWLQHRPHCFLSWKTAESWTEECVFFFVLQWVSAAALRPGCAAFVAVVVITLAPNQHTPQCFSCLCFSAFVFLELLNIVCVLCKEASHGEFFSINSALKCFRWLFHIWRTFLDSHL